MSENDASEFVALHARLAELVADIARVDLAEASQLLRYAIQMAEVSAAAVDGSKLDTPPRLRDFRESPSLAETLDNVQAKHCVRRRGGRTKGAEKIHKSIAALSKRVENVWTIAITSREGIDDPRWAFPSKAREQTPPR